MLALKKTVYLSVTEVVLLNPFPAGDCGPGFGRLHAQSPRFSSGVHTALASGVHLPSLLDGLKLSATAADCQSENSFQSSQSPVKQEESQPYSSWCSSELRPSCSHKWPEHLSSLFSCHSSVTLNSPLIPSWVTRPTSLNSEENKSSLLFLFWACTLLQGCAVIGWEALMCFSIQIRLGPFWSGRRWVWLIHYVNWPIKW